MTTTRDSSAVATVSEEALAELGRLYEAGQYLQAYRRAMDFGPLREWRGAEARVMAGRMANNLGGPVLGRVLLYRAHREHPEHPLVAYYYSFCVLERRGPLGAWRYLRERGELAGASSRIRSDWLAMHAEVLSHLRDFARADEYLRRAEELVGAGDAVNRAWLGVQRSGLLERQDRYEEALAAARQALTWQAEFRPAVQATAHLLTLLGRDDDALAFLREVAAGGESCNVLAQLASLEQELGQYAEALATLERIPAAAPLLDRAYRNWLYVNSADAAYHTGQLARARDGALQVTRSKFHKAFAERLTEQLHADGNHMRVRLPVGFVRQHDLTCAPATLATLTRFWGRPASHLEIAEKICYDGTPQHADRSWAVANGYVAREFTCTWETAVALVDRGVPFGFCTVDPGNGHAQAVIGYDKLRGTLLIRDPYVRNAFEFIADKALERYRSSGPRCLVILPAERAELLEGIELPEAGLYDQLYAVQAALERHDRPAAAGACAALTAAAPGHRITLYAQRCLASYDANRPAALAATDALLALFPDDANLLLSKISLLRDTASRDTRLELLRQAAATKTEPLFWREYAQELLPDARQHELARRLLARSLRRSPVAAGNYVILGNVHWSQRRFEEAFELYRFAACLDVRDEQLAQTFFRAAPYLKRTEQALAFLHDRHGRLGGKSSAPARTLFYAYESLEQTPKALEILHEALARRADDGALLLFAASAYTRYGQVERGAELLRAAEGKTHRLAWLQAAAEMAGLRSEHGEALGLWRQLLELDPLAVEAHRAVANLLASRESPAAALAHVRQAVERFPHHYQLHLLLVQMTQNEDPGAMEAVVRRMAALFPDDAWAHRELALVLSALNQFDEAMAEANIGGRLEPNAARTFNTLGAICARAGQANDARKAYRHALRLSIDNEPAITGLMELCNTTEERRAVLAVVQKELVRQVIFGHGLLVFRSYARAVLDPKETTARLREALAARPDLWHAWSALVAQVVENGALDEAHELATQATDRFPLLAEVWCDLAQVCEVRQERDGQVAALRRALQIAPAWGRPARILAGVYEAGGDLKQAKVILEQAIAKSPLDHDSHGYLAQVLWKLEDKEAAIARLEHALLLEPRVDWGWRMLEQWCSQTGQTKRALDHVRRLTERRGGEAGSWMILARLRRSPDELAARLGALDRAAELDPRNSEAYDLRAALLAEAGRYDEALAACSPAIFKGKPPSPLLARAAWVTAQRGDKAQAIEQMRKVLAHEQSNLWAWQRLADWLRGLNRNVEYVETATRMTELWPMDASCLDYLADARLRNAAVDNDCRKRAKADLRRSVALDPTREWAANMLFDLQMEDSDFDEVPQTLEMLRRQRAPDNVLVREIQLAARREETEAAKEKFRRLAGSRTVSRDHLDDAMRAIAGAHGLSLAAAKAALPVLSPQPPNVHIAAVIVNTFARYQDFNPAMTVMNQLARDSDAWYNAAVDYLSALADLRRLVLVRSFVDAHAVRLRSDNELWAHAGWAFATAGDDHPATVAWMADWQTRGEVRPWPLVIYANALRQVGRVAEAHAVSLAALPRKDDGSHQRHQLFLALDDLVMLPAAGGMRVENVDGRAAQLARWQETLAGIDPARLNAYFRFLYNLCDLALRLHQAHAGGTVLADAYSRLSATEAIMPKFVKDRSLREAYHRVLGVLWRAQSSPRTWFEVVYRYVRAAYQRL